MQLEKKERNCSQDSTIGTTNKMQGKKKQNFFDFSNFIPEMVSQVDNPNSAAAFHVHSCMKHSRMCSPGLEEK